MYTEAPTSRGDSPGLRIDAAHVRSPGDLYRPTWYAPVKRVADILTALILLVLSAPIFLLSLLLVKLTSSGPALYAQRRVGLGGRGFTLYKIRSMEHNCERLTGPRWATEDDPRITSVGRFLRRTHLDELPQLWNILRGDMSLIGPRPERPEFVAMLEKAIPHYQARLLVRPGITGLAQLRLPPDSDLEGVRKKTAHDLWYVQHLGPWLDVQIAVGTMSYAFQAFAESLDEAMKMPGGDHVMQAYEDLAARTAVRKARALLSPRTDTASDIGPDMNLEPTTPVRDRELHISE